MLEHYSHQRFRAKGQMLARLEEQRTAEDGLRSIALGGYSAVTVVPGSRLSTWTYGLAAKKRLRRSYFVASLSLPSAPNRFASSAARVIACRHRSIARPVPSSKLATTRGSTASTVSFARASSESDTDQQISRTPTNAEAWQLRLRIRPLRQHQQAVSTHGRRHQVSAASCRRVSSPFLGSPTPCAS